MGTRRVLITGTGPMGSVPAELALRSGNGECDVELQRAVSLFRVKTLLKKKLEEKR